MCILSFRGLPGQDFEPPQFIEHISLGTNANNVIFTAQHKTEERPKHPLLWGQQSRNLTKLSLTQLCSKQKFFSKNCRVIIVYHLQTTCWMLTEPAHYFSCDEQCGILKIPTSFVLTSPPVLSQ